MILKSWKQLGIIQKKTFVNNSIALDLRIAMSKLRQTSLVVCCSSEFFFPIV